MNTLIVIGGGAAGLSAAIAAAMCGDEVVLLERMDRVGKKILATGNGRCNLMNTGEPRFPGGAAMAEAVLSHCGAEEQTRFWAHLGLRMRYEEAGRVYPVSGTASSVLDTLRQTLRALNVQVVTDARVTALEKAHHGWRVRTGETAYTAQRVIVAGGGCAQPKLGSDGSAWKLLTDLGHRMVKPRPALTQIITDPQPIRGLSGIRVRCALRVTYGDAEICREQGELLFADYGVSGVCVMQCARYVAPGSVLHIDMTKGMGFASADEFRSELQRRRNLWGNNPALTMQDLLTGLCVAKISQTLIRSAGIERSHEMPVHAMTDRQMNRLVQAAADFRLTVKGVKGFESAQVTAGGVSVEAFAPKTMASLIAPGIHAAGEVLDVDGDCGGFNLMFAFGSGILAGLNGRKPRW